MDGASATTPYSCITCGSAQELIEHLLGWTHDDTTERTRVPMYDNAGNNHTRLHCWSICGVLSSNAVTYAWQACQGSELRQKLSGPAAVTGGLGLMYKVPSMTG